MGTTLRRIPSVAVWSSRTCSLRTGGGRPRSNVDLAAPRWKTIGDELLVRTPGRTTRTWGSLVHRIDVDGRGPGTFGRPFIDIALSSVVDLSKAQPVGRRLQSSKLTSSQGHHGPPDDRRRRWILSIPSSSKDLGQEGSAQRESRTDAHVCSPIGSKTQSRNRQRISRSSHVGGAQMTSASTSTFSFGSRASAVPACSSSVTIS